MDLEHFQDLILLHDTVSTIPRELIRYLHKKNIFVRPHTIVRRGMLPAFAVNEHGEECDFLIQLLPADAPKKRKRATSQCKTGVASQDLVNQGTQSETLVQL